MNVLHINTLLRGGAGRAAQRLQKGLLEVGVATSLMTLENSMTDIPGHIWFPAYFENPVARKTMLAAAKVRHWQYKLGQLRKPKSHEPYRQIYSPYDITRHEKYKSADLVHLHWVPGFLDFLSFFKKNNKPVVWTLHDMFPFSGGYHYEVGFPVTAFNKEIEKQLKLKKELYTGQNIHVVGLSEWLTAKSRSSNLLGQFPHHLIQNGLETAIFKYQDKVSARVELNLPKYRTICLFVSDYLDNPRKGLQLLLEAWSKVEQEDVMLVAIGKPTEAFKKINGLEIFGLVRDDEILAQLYAAADVFILPSIEDNLPNTVMEALSCGCPVLAFETGGIPDMVDNKRNGLLVKEQDPSALGKGINEILKQSGEFNRYNIALKASEKFDYRLQAKRMKALYKSILSE
ncbi:MAG: glycosyltransferase [Bacteroidota bacterium]